MRGDLRGKALFLSETSASSQRSRRLNLLSLSPHPPSTASHRPKKLCFDTFCVG